MSSITKEERQERLKGAMKAREEIRNAVRMELMSDPSLRSEIRNAVVEVKTETIEEAVSTAIRRRLGDPKQLDKFIEDVIWKKIGTSFMNELKSNMASLAGEMAVKMIKERIVFDIHQRDTELEEVVQAERKKGAAW